MIDLLIGIPTYNDYQRINYLLDTIMDVTDFGDITYEIVILDDGTKDPAMVAELIEIAAEFNIELIEHKKNEGIPKSWNDLARSRDSKYICLFNDDIGVTDPNWARDLIYFFENNEKIGSVGFPLIHIDPSTGKPNEERNVELLLNDENVPEKIPGRCGAPVGCCFGFTRELFNEVGGFWNELVSFYEEVLFGFQAAEKGYFSYMLPTCIMEHRGSQTFGSNRELSIRKIDNNILTKEEYIKIVSPLKEKWPHDLFFYSVTDEGKIFQNPEGEYVGRMGYSRAMFSKKWGIIDYYEAPEVEVHKRLVDPAPKVIIRWLDFLGVKRETII